MITKLTIPYGSSMAGLIDFVFGPGEDGEHSDPHVIAAPPTSSWGTALIPRWLG